MTDEKDQIIINTAYAFNINAEYPVLTVICEELIKTYSQRKNIKPKVQMDTVNHAVSYVYPDNVCLSLFNIQNLLCIGGPDKESFNEIVELSETIIRSILQ